MFSKTIIDSDEFLDMPASARLLYFDLGMRADDDGFVNPKRVMRITNAATDDLKVLLAKKYIINFENKVLVIRDWKINNFIRPDRYTPTIYQEYLKRLEVSSSNQYQLNSGMSSGIPLGSPSIGKVRLELGKDNISNGKSVAEPPINELITLFKDISPTNYKNWFKNKTQRNSSKNLFKYYSLEELEKIVNFLPKINSTSYIPKDCKAFSPYELNLNIDKIKAKCLEFKGRKEENKNKTAVIL